ncbi:Auxin-induced protein [Macleaya cordata]|uniref:Auxin-induced protein n=1 Tax=Macleaya cordata TaxID=56857 RepID=A0A200Q919_MACCD|nr:Auxin-induced protein [Macleaya cordata]
MANRIIKNNRERKRGMVMLMLIMQKLWKGTLLPLARRRVFNYLKFVEEEMGAAMATVPEDVKEGHFAVFAVKGDEPKRFIVELDFLNNPAFLRLLEKAEEEFGFEQEGVLAVPCRPDELGKIVGSSRRKNVFDGGLRRSLSRSVSKEN